MTENNWYKLKPAIDVNNPMGIVETKHWIVDSDNVDDSIKTLYNKLVTLETEFSDIERTLRGEINYLHAENRKLSNEIADIKQALYFG